MKSLRKPNAIIACRFFCSVCVALLFGVVGYSQDSKNNKLHSDFYYHDRQVSPFNTDSLPLFINTSLNGFAVLSHDTLWSYQKLCKSLSVLKCFKVASYDSINNIVSKTSKPTTAFLQIHGNLQYDYLYRSFVDTPFSQHDFQQHTVQTNLSILIKDKYPVKVNFSNRQSNSPYFRSLPNINMQFDRYAYIKTKKQELLDRIEKNALQNPEFIAMEGVLEDLKSRYDQLQKRLNSPDVLQKIIQERENLYYSRVASGLNRTEQNLPVEDIYKINERLTHKSKRFFGKGNDFSQPNQSYQGFVDDRKIELDSLGQEISRIQSKSDSLKNALSKRLGVVRKKIYEARNASEYEKIASENGIVEKRKKDLSEFLSKIKSIGIGRSFVNYSELTAWNISLTGFNMEYNAGIYTALGVGKIDYGFPYFKNKLNKRKSQNLLIGRFGIGDKDRKAIIFSAFTGRKYNNGSAFTDTVSDQVNIIGYSLEALLKKDENTSLSAELAKTTKPISGSFADNRNLHSLLNFSDRSNLGLSIKAQTLIHSTDTRLSGFYKRTGEAFQSFSLFSYNTNQTSWLFKADQSFLRDRMNVVVMLRRNDFTNPFTEKSFKASTVFKSFQLNLRIPGLPMLSAGYYPGTQLYIIDKDRIRENAYYILNGSIVHNYLVGSLPMITSIVYNSYSSKGTDSGFISYEGKSYIASQALVLPKMRFQGSYMFSDQEQMKYYTLEGTGDFSLTKNIRAGGGTKYNRLVSGGIFWGKQAELSIDILKLGTLQLQYEKSYLPTIQQLLYPVESGRLSWLKYF